MYLQLQAALAMPPTRRTMLLHMPAKSHTVAESCIPVPIRITHLCAPWLHRRSDPSSASLLDRLTTATFSFYTCYVSVLSIAAFFFKSEECFISLIVKKASSRMQIHD